jgi:hypothetical protein
MVLSNLLQVKVESHDNFKIIIETLTRMGTKIKTERKLIQSCFLLKVFDDYYLAHYKEIQVLNGKKVEIEDEDYAMRNTVATLLEIWGILIIKSKNVVEEYGVLGGIDVLSHAKKEDWTLIKNITIDELKVAQRRLEDDYQKGEI